MFEITEKLIQSCPLPNMFRVKQLFPRPVIAPEQIPAYLTERLSAKSIADRIRPGQRIAITAGSRGIANIALVTKTIADFVKQRGANPFIVPAMGSHGNASAEGQTAILRNLGITEEFCGCRILSSMEVVQIGLNDEGGPVYLDKNAAQADGIIVSCRIKPHTSFRGTYESGIMKMMAIGLGKQVGAQACHREGFKYMAKNIPLYGKAVLRNAPVLFAVAVIENAFDETCKIAVVKSEEIPEREPVLLKEAFSMMPRIYYDSCDVLVVDRIGKNFSGDGMDPNISGTHCTPYTTGGISSQHVVVLDVSEESHGNAMGIGHATVTTKRAVDKLNLDAMYANAVTCKIANGCTIPLYLSNDRQAIRMALQFCVDYDRGHPKIIRIPNSSHIEHIMLSEAYYDSAIQNPNLVVESKPEPFPFGPDGNLPYNLDER